MRKASPALIGVFVIVAVVLGVAAVGIFGGGRLFGETLRYVVFFDGSVKGLSVGAPVTFRGVKMGYVAEVRVQFNSGDGTVAIPVYIEIEPERVRVVGDSAEPDAYARIAQFVERGLRAQLQLQSLVTGQLTIMLDFHPETPARLTGYDPRTPELPTVPSSMEEISRTLEALPLEEILTRMNKIAAGIDRLVNAPEAEQGLRKLAASLEQTERILSDVSAQVTPLVAQVESVLTEADALLRKVSANVEPLAAEAHRALDQAAVLARNTDERLAQLSASVDQAVAETRTELAATVAETRAFLRNADRHLTPMLVDAQQGARHGEAMLRPESAFRQQLDSALAELASAARSMRLLTEYLERHPEALIRGKKK